MGRPKSSVGRNQLENPHEPSKKGSIHKTQNFPKQHVVGWKKNRLGEEQISTTRFAGMEGSDISRKLLWMGTTP